MMKASNGAVFFEMPYLALPLWRVWDPGQPCVNVIGLNPSTADETQDDPTIRRCIGFAKSWGCGGLYMTNLLTAQPILA